VESFVNGLAAVFMSVGGYLCDEKPTAVRGVCGDDFGNKTKTGILRGVGSQGGVGIVERIGGC
jgi:hypothetical protein